MMTAAAKCLTIWVRYGWERAGSNHRSLWRDTAAGKLAAASDWFYFCLPDIKGDDAEAKERTDINKAAAYNPKQQPRLQQSSTMRVMACLKPQVQVLPLPWRVACIDITGLGGCLAWLSIRTVHILVLQSYYRVQGTPSTEPQLSIKQPPPKKIFSSLCLEICKCLDNS